MDPIDIHSMGKSTMYVIQFCVQKKKETHAGFELENDDIIFIFG